MSVWLRPAGCAKIYRSSNAKKCLTFVLNHCEHIGSGGGREPRSFSYKEDDDAGTKKQQAKAVLASGKVPL